MIAEKIVFSVQIIRRSWRQDISRFDTAGSGQMAKKSQHPCWLKLLEAM